MTGATAGYGVAEDRQLQLRVRRWRIFLLLFAATCVGVALDVITTYLGIQRIGTKFEQNGIALFLINRIGWVGLTILLVLVSVLCIKSFKLVYWNLGLQWSRWLNIFVATVCAFRWIVVISDIIWLIRR